MSGAYAANRYGGYIPVSTGTGRDISGGDTIQKIYVERQIEKPLPKIRLAKRVVSTKYKKPNIILKKIEEGEPKND